MSNSGAAHADVHQYIVKRYIKVAVVVVIVAGAICFIRLIKDARLRAREIGCPSRMKQIGLAFHLYARDHGGTFPPDLRSLDKYVERQSGMFVCPCGKTVPGVFESVDQWTDYIYLSGATEIDHTNRIVLLCRDGKHGRDVSSSVLFVDGRVQRFLTPRELKNQEANRVPGD